jgi:hypothetical protein
MELITKINATTRVSAGLEEDGTLSLKVFAQAEYAPGKTTTAEVPSSEIPDALKAKVAQALADVAEHAQPALGPRLQRAMVKSHEVSAQMGEL